MKTQDYRTVDGVTFAATDPADLVRQLRLDSWNPEESDEAYLRATARAAELQTGKPHRHESPLALVKDMIASGLIIQQGEEISHD